MRLMHTFAVMLMLTMTSAAFAADHPKLDELTPLLGKPIDSDEVQSLVKKYDLRKGYKFDAGSFTSGDEAYSLLFRENRVSAIILRASPWPKGYGEANWTVYSRALPHDLKATDDRKQVENKLGKPTVARGDRWLDGALDVWVHFAEKEAAIEEVWVLAAPAKT